MGLKPSQAWWYPQYPDFFLAIYRGPPCTYLKCPSRSKPFETTWLEIVHRNIPASGSCGGNWRGCPRFHCWIQWIYSKLFLVSTTNTTGMMKVWFIWVNYLIYNSGMPILGVHFNGTHFGGSSSWCQNINGTFDGFLWKNGASFGLAWKLLMICRRLFLKCFLAVFHPETWGNRIQFDEHIFFSNGGQKTTNYLEDHPR